MLIHALFFAMCSLFIMPATNAMEINPLQQSQAQHVPTQPVPQIASQETASVTVPLVQYPPTPDDYLTLLQATCDYAGNTGLFTPDSPRLLYRLALALSSAVNKNSAEKPTIRATLFHSFQAPSIPPFAYIHRAISYMRCSESCYICACIYIDRMALQCNIPLTFLTFHRLFALALISAAKFLDDTYYSQNYYARVFGLSVAKLNALELEFLLFLNFSLWISEEDYIAYKTRLETIPIEPPLPQMIPSDH